MRNSLKNFFVFSLLLLFFYSSSGIGVCMEHARHTENNQNFKDLKKGKGIYISQGDDCQCALHFQMNNVLLPEPLAIEFPFDHLINDEIPYSKAISYRCLIDYFSSRAPPVSFFSVV